jgi:hypothetical protein
LGISNLLTMICLGSRAKGSCRVKNFPIFLRNYSNYGNFQWLEAVCPSAPTHSGPGRRKRSMCGRVQTASTGVRAGIDGQEASIAPAPN